MYSFCGRFILDGIHVYFHICRLSTRAVCVTQKFGVGWCVVNSLAVVCGLVRICFVLLFQHWVAIAG